MINIEALFDFSYGLYIVSSGTPQSGNGYISNTVFQVTSTPILFAATCHKDNHTCDIIKKTEAFAVSVLHTECPLKVISALGYHSGKTTNKLEGFNIKYGETGVPIFLDEAMAYIECKVKLQFDIGTHIIFIGEVVQTEILDETKEPMTYAYYRRVHKALSPKNSPTYINKEYIEKLNKSDLKLYKCAVCGFVYDEELGLPENGIKPGTLFKDLPDDWVCPVCGSAKEEFHEIE